MCGRLLLACFVLLLLPVCFAAAEQEYRISEFQLQSIEKSLERLEQDRRSWESQARELRNEAASLNRQLAEEREQYKTLEQSFSRYETSQSARMSELTREAAMERLEKEKHKGTSRTRLIVIVVLAGSWVLFAGFKVWRFLRPVPKK